MLTDQKLFSENSLDTLEMRVAVAVRCVCLLVTWKEDKHLVSRVIVVGDQHSEICPPWAPFTRLVPKLALELVQSLVQLILRHKVASVVAQLCERGKTNKWS